MTEAKKTDIERLIAESKEGDLLYEIREVIVEGFYEDKESSKEVL